MKRTVLSGILAAIVLATPVRAGDITYNLLSDTSVQNGWTLSGTVTTDGTGYLYYSDIVSWTLTLSKSGQTSITASSSDSGAQTTGGGLQATKSALTVSNNLSFITNDTSVTWNPHYDAYVAATTAGNVWFTFPNTTNLPKGGTWTVATASVPEPSSVVMGLIGGLSAMGYGFYRRRKSASRPAGIA